VGKGQRLDGLGGLNKFRGAIVFPHRNRAASLNEGDWDGSNTTIDTGKHTAGRLRTGNCGFLLRVLSVQRCGPGRFDETQLSNVH